MQIASVRASSLVATEDVAHTIVVGCGYEHRSRGIASMLHTLPPQRIALCFTEFADIYARVENQQFFFDNGFSLAMIGANEPLEVEQLICETIRHIPPESSRILFDISTMTRAWHGAIVKCLRSATYTWPVTTYFAYNPSLYLPPRQQPAPNEIVAPVDGFSSLSAPDLPVAAVIGLGYERESALGLQQILDPALTVLFVPDAGEEDKYRAQVLRNNSDILARTSTDWVLDYTLDRPADTFATLASLIAGLRQSHRVVLVSLGPKMFGMICFLLATEYPDVSVWRISSGIHSKPRNSYPDLSRTTVLEVVWKPDSQLNEGPSRNL